MAPPKKDAFADLFQSASRGSSNTNLNSKLNTLSLSERQKLQETPSQLYSQPQSVNSSWSNADILTPSRQASPAAESVQPVAAQGSGSKKEVYDDPFDIFKDQNSTSKEQPKKNQLTEISLLDDDFTDFFKIQEVHQRHLLLLKMLRMMCPFHTMQPLLHLNEMTVLVLSNKVHHRKLHLNPSLLNKEI